MSAKSVPLPQQPESNIFGDYFTRDEIVKARGICARTWLRLEQSGRGPVRTVIGRTILYRKDKFREWLLSREERNGVHLSANGRPFKGRRGVQPRRRKSVSSVARNVLRTRRAA